MLKTLAVKGFKSLVDTGPIEFAPVTVLFGPNGGGKSNVLDALNALARVARSDPPEQVEAFVRALRGRPIEQFSFGEGGLSALVEADERSARIAATLVTAPRWMQPWQYDLAFTYRSRTGQLSIRELSPPALSESVVEFGRWRSYYLDPRVAMRAEQSPLPLLDIGSFGERLISFLFQLKTAHPEAWASIRRTLPVVVPSVERLDLRLDERAGTLELEVVQDGVAYSSRLVSDGTLRVLGLMAALAEPGAGLIAFEEPENGVHPQRVELIARMLVAAGIDAREPKQIIVTTHSPVLCGALIRQAREHPGKITLLRTVSGGHGTRVRPLDLGHPAFRDDELRRQLASVDDVSVFEGLILRGLLDD